MLTNFYICRPNLGPCIPSEDGHALRYGPKEKNGAIASVSGRTCTSLRPQEKYGAIAQLARAFDWQSRGRGFDSPWLHRRQKAAFSCFLHFEEMHWRRRSPSRAFGNSPWLHRRQKAAFSCFLHFEEMHWGGRSPSRAFGNSPWLHRRQKAAFSCFLHFEEMHWERRSLSSAFGTSKYRVCVKAERTFLRPPPHSNHHQPITFSQVSEFPPNPYVYIITSRYEICISVLLWTFRFVSLGPKPRP
jgi:hypothetical protein